MTGFTIGMIAAGLWLVAAVGMWLFLRTAPGHPFRTIRGFRNARRTLSSGPEAIELPITQPEPGSQTFEPPALQPGAEVRDGAPLNGALGHSEAPDGAPLNGASGNSVQPGNSKDDLAHLLNGSPEREPPALEPDDEPDDEMAAMIDSITSDQPADPKPRRPRRDNQPRGPIKKGRITYVLVDDEGRPLLD